MKTTISVSGRGLKVQGNLVRTARIVGEKYLFVEDPKPLIESLRNSDTRVDLFTFLQRLPETSPKYPYPMVWDNLAVIEVTSLEYWRDQQIRSYARNRSRQAEKRGVTIREVPFDEALVKGIWEVYNESPIRQGRPSAHYGKDLETVYKEEATYPDLSIFIGAFIGEELIGFVKLVCDETRTQANLMNIVSMVKHRDKAPTNALIAHSVRVCAERGIRFLVYQNFTYGNKKPDGLAKFKEVNGFQRVEIPRYYVPLTPIGRAALRLQLHRRFVDRLPAPVAEKLRELVKRWYNRKYKAVAETA